MENTRLTFNNDKTYGWNVPLTLRSRKIMSVIITLKDGTELTYTDVIEYEHMYSKSWGEHAPDEACVEFINGEYASLLLDEIDTIHITDSL